MNDKIWAVVLSSALVLEIYRNIRDYFRERRLKRDESANIPAQVAKISAKLDRMESDNSREFADIRKSLDENVRHTKNLDDSVDKLETALQHNARGTALGLENDLVIFNALRTNHINGDSEIAERKVKDYLVSSTQETYSV